MNKDKCKYKKSELSKEFIVARLNDIHKNAMLFNLDPCCETMKVIFKNEYVRQYKWNEKKIDKLFEDISDLDIIY